MVSKSIILYLVVVFGICNLGWAMALECDVIVNQGESLQDGLNKACGLSSTFISTICVVAGPQPFLDAINIGQNCPGKEFHLVGLADSQGKYQVPILAPVAIQISLRSFSFNNFIFDLSRAGKGIQISSYWAWFSFRPSIGQSLIQFESVSITNIDQYPSIFGQSNGPSIFYLITQQANFIKVNITDQRIIPYALFTVTPDSTNSLSINIDSFYFANNAAMHNFLFGVPLGSSTLSSFTMTRSTFINNANLNSLFVLYFSGPSPTFSLSDSAFVNNSLSFPRVVGSTVYASPISFFVLMSPKDIAFQNNIFKDNSNRVISPINTSWCVGSALINLNSGFSLPLRANSNSFLNNLCTDQTPGSNNAAMLPISYPPNYSPFNISASSNIVKPQPFCPPGSEWATLTCMGCSPGFFSSQPSLQCQPCPAGSFIDSIGSTSCRPCNSGYYSPPGQKVCPPCPAGTFSAAAGSPQCFPCPSNYFQSFPASSYCLPCAPSFCAPPSSTTCSLCSSLNSLHEILQRFRFVEEKIRR